MNKIVVIALAVFVSAFAAACSNGSGVNSTSTANVPASNANSAAGNTASAKPADETPSQVKAAFPDAQSFTTQHKDVPQNSIAEIERDAGGKVPGSDHHSYLAFSTAAGTRRQIGAATVVKAEGKDLVIVYENKSGSPYIKQIKAEGFPGPFLDQFAGKGHDDKFAFGTEIKANGLDESTARAITTAVKIDVLTMQALYGAAHTH